MWTRSCCCGRKVDDDVTVDELLRLDDSELGDDELDEAEDEDNESTLLGASSSNSFSILFDCSAMPWSGVLQVKLR